jgi:hypothetical protein
MDLDTESRRGRDARRLLAEPLLVEAFATVHTALQEAWLATGDAQERERERLWLMLKLLGRLRAHLSEAAETGRLADRQLEMLQAQRATAAAHS